MIHHAYLRGTVGFETCVHLALSENRMPLYPEPYDNFP